MHVLGVLAINLQVDVVLLADGLEYAMLENEVMDKRHGLVARILEEDLNAYRPFLARIADELEGRLFNFDHVSRLEGWVQIEAHLTNELAQILVANRTNVDHPAVGGRCGITRRSHHERHLIIRGILRNRLVCVPDDDLFLVVEASGLSSSSSSSSGSE